MANYTGQNAFAASAVQVIIPRPIVELLTPVQSSPFLSWYQASKEFLNYNPKFFLFRYRGYRNLNGKINLKGYHHPVHLNGSTRNGSAWWGSSSQNADGTLVPPRNTEWDIDPNEGRHIDTNINPANWFSDLGGNAPIALPVPRGNQSPTGRGRMSTLRQYFRFAIGVEYPDVQAGCPVTFGPFSDVCGFARN